MSRRWMIPAVLLALALLGAFGLIVWGSWISARVEPKVFEVLAQLVLLAGFGGVGSLVVDELNRARESREQTRERLRNALSDLIKSYNKIKSLRRRLRAEAVRPNYEDPHAVVNGREYAALLQLLNDEQLSIEAHLRLVEGNSDVYADSKILIHELGIAEKSLGKLVSEWERNLGSFEGDTPQQSLAELPSLRCFVGDADTGFGPSVADPISNVLKTLSRAIAR